MSNYLSDDGTFINSLIGEGSLFKGDLSIDGLLRIDGDFKGIINQGGKVLVGKSGRVEASVNAGTVVIGGVLKGNVVASEKVVILSTGMLIGNVTAPRLLVEEGVILNGSCNITKKEDQNKEKSMSPGMAFNAASVKRREMETVAPWTK